jgi:hypothetical protein
MNKILLILSILSIISPTLQAAPKRVPNHVEEQESLPITDITHIQSVAQLQTPLVPLVAAPRFVATRQKTSEGSTDRHTFQEKTRLERVNLWNDWNNRKNSIDIHIAPMKDTFMRDVLIDVGTVTAVTAFLVASKVIHMMIEENSQGK